MDVTLEMIGRAISDAQSAIENPRGYFTKLIVTGISVSFLISCFLGTIFGLVKIFFL